MAATCGALRLTSPVVRKPSKISFGLALWCAGKPLLYCLNYAVWQTDRVFCATTCGNRVPTRRRCCEHIYVVEPLHRVCCVSRHAAITTPGRESLSHFLITAQNGRCFSLFCLKVGLIVEDWFVLFSSVQQLRSHLDFQVSRLFLKHENEAEITTLLLLWQLFT